MSMKLTTFSASRQARNYPLFRSNNPRGFSLIELMLIISIISLLIIISLPSYTGLKIKAARTEALLNLKTIRSLAESHHADNSEYPLSFAYGSTGKSWGPRHMNSDLCTTSNALGFTTSNCSKLRYYYYFSGIGGMGNEIDPSKRLYFTAQASSVYVQSGGYITSSGNPITKNCSSRTNGSGRDRMSWDIYFSDVLTIFESGVIQPYFNSPSYDMTKQCYDGAGVAYGYVPPTAP